MDPLPTLDVLLNDAATGKDRLTRAVESAIAALLAELAGIEAFDKATATWGTVPFDRQAAANARQLFELWLPVAEGLEQRVKASIARAGPMVGADKLEYAIGKTMARLASATVDDMEQIAADQLQGRVIRYASMEEMRRELLHPRVPGHGPSPISAAEPVAPGGGA